MLCCRCAGTYDNGLQRHIGKFSTVHTLGLQHAQGWCAIKCNELYIQAVDKLLTSC